MKQVKMSRENQSSTMDGVPIRYKRVRPSKHQVIVGLGVLLLLGAAGATLEILSPDYDSLHAAIRAGDDHYVWWYLTNNKGPVDEPDESGMSPFLLASRLGNEKILSHLINLGFLGRNGRGIDVKHGDGFTPLHHVARDGNEFVAMWLIGVGASLNIHGGPIGLTPLDLAAENEHESLVYKLRKWGGLTADDLLLKGEARVAKIDVDSSGNPHQLTFEFDGRTETIRSTEFNIKGLKREIEDFWCGTAIIEDHYFTLYRPEVELGENEIAYRHYTPAELGAGSESSNHIPVSGYVSPNP